MAAGVVVCSVALAGSRPSGYDNSPFGQLGEAAYGWSSGAEQGVVLTDGMLVLQNHSGRPVRLLSVAFEPGQPGLELVGAKVAGLDRAIGSYQQLPSFPPVDDAPDVVLGELADLHGYVIPPGGEYTTHGVELLLGVRKTVPGRATRRAVLVTYEMGSRRAVARFGSTIALCEPARARSCPPEYGDTGRGSE